MVPKILIIDDESGVRDMLRGHFEARGFEVLAAADGREGINFCRTCPPEVILLDFKMKSMDGDRALPELRRLAPRSRIFLISAYPKEIVYEKTKGARIDAYFEKPVPILELERAVCRAFVKP